MLYDPLPPHPPLVPILTRTSSSALKFDWIAKIKYGSARQHTEYEWMACTLYSSIYAMVRARFMCLTTLRAQHIWKFALKFQWWWCFCCPCWFVHFNASTSSTNIAGISDSICDRALSIIHTTERRRKINTKSFSFSLFLLVHSHNKMIRIYIANENFWHGTIPTILWTFLC